MVKFGDPTIDWIARWGTALVIGAAVLGVICWMFFSGDIDLSVGDLGLGKSLGEIMKGMS